MTWPDGSKYTGNWLDSKKEGTGRMEYADKSVYDGLWRGDKVNSFLINQIFFFRRS